jgi:putative hemolysin
MNAVEPQEFESLSPVFKGKTGLWLAKLVMRILAADQFNRVYDQASHLTGAPFMTGFLKGIGVEYQIGNAERLDSLPQGAFITISNHPYGGLDGTITMELMITLRSDYKFMVNKLLTYVKPMKENFIWVTPETDHSTGVTSSSLGGIRETLKHLRTGHPVGFFPSGAVSDFRLKDFRIRDREWKKSIIGLIHAAKVPIVPIRFFDRNSAFFYFLGLLDYRIRSVRILHELFNKRKQHPRVAIGKIIGVEEQKQFPDLESFGAFLRNEVYEMPLPEFFTPRSRLIIHKENLQTQNQTE